MGQTSIKKITKLTPMNPARPGALPPNNPLLETQRETPKITPKITLSCCDACDSEEKPAVVKPAAPQLSCCSSCSTDAPTTAEQKSKSRFSFHFISSKQRLVIAGFLAVAAEILDWFETPSLFPAILALLAVALSGVATYKKGWQALRRFDPNMHALMSIAVTGACLIGQWPEAAMVMVLFNIAEFLEGKSLERARTAIQELMTLTPEQALVQQPDGNWKILYTNTVSVNQVIRVKPGVRIPLDGVVIRGNSSVDQAPITGESLPVDKSEGDVVYAGTINQQGSFDYRVTATTQNTLLARIIHSVEQAQSKRAPIQSLVDRFARVYTPIILTIAVLVALVPPLFFAASWYAWIYKALVLLVIGCPCALVLSTPVAIVSALSVAAKHGILIKGGSYLELGRKLQIVALDKTGTLTTGTPQLCDQVTLTERYAEECLELAAALASHSDHPVSQAIVRAHPTDTSHFIFEDFTALTGAGVQAMLNGKQIALTNQQHLSARNNLTSELGKTITRLEQQGKTVVILSEAEQLLALFAVADTIKTSSQQAIAELHRMHIHTVMLTGDNAHTAAQIAAQAGIDQVYSNQLPEDKLNQIEALSKQKVVGMVGDGINDAPALARASLGFAMGGMGSDTAIETADIVLMDDDLRKIPQFVRLSQATWNKMLQNITAALGIKLLFLVATLLGFGTLWMAVFADVGTSLLVVANAMRLLKFK
ncbi:heavy metal translocating P-type ATPase [uncultured Tolumonas sp.]|uniref:heavy metal translocating P-type ATPase n=1 Tax=uncultured Tolumonas sp. TaxID=263765 RepID=UPI0029305FFC|nr:heavy metal translocating P-type ATPase [uncultured Tolumonas sp.]